MSNLSIDEIIELMEELLDNSSAVPFSSKKMIDCEQMRDYIDNLHLSLPAELEKAKNEYNYLQVITESQGNTAPEGKHNRGSKRRSREDNPQG